MGVVIEICVKYPGVELELTSLKYISGLDPILIPRLLCYCTGIL
jgi:hypothetical protein